jgi:hypothetical protein
MRYLRLGAVVGFLALIACSSNIRSTRSLIDKHGWIGDKVDSEVNGKTVTCTQEIDTTGYYKVIEATLKDTTRSVYDLRHETILELEKQVKDLVRLNCTTTDYTSVDNGDKVISKDEQRRLVREYFDPNRIRPFDRDYVQRIVADRVSQ